ncbi:uncharacterized protein LOC129749460 [Uranotaenia lowii]|uniref:uncharacterized protein LOC129748723 n=1 Tax=Uranotaenia lowii TaxID=190385 RepID=UPI00247919BC|nr:uncharacterized protein LOC129748723 [Uranotaenia lowii]XP_055600410.1 uncharacterized protein LOC129749460 [Uranotaenia lowii]
MKYLLAISLVFAANLAVGFGEIPPILSICNTTEPEYAKCLQDVVEGLRPNIASGDYGPGRNTTQLEPFNITKLDIDKGDSFKCLLRNLSITGVSKFVFKKIRDDIPNKWINISTRLPLMVTKGKYDLKMNLLLLKITGKGDFNLTLKDTLCNLKIKWYIDEQDDKRFIKFNPIDVRLKFDKAKFYLDNLFGGDPALSVVGNEAINANPMVLLDEVRPTLEENLRSSLTEIANTVVEGAEEDEIFPS